MAGSGARLHWEVTKRSFRRYAAYRSATAAGVFTNTIFGFIKAYVLLAVYKQRSHVGDFAAVDAVTFVFVSQGMLAVVNAFSGGRELALRIKTGDVVTDLYRPVNFQTYWLAQDLGRAGFQAIFRGLPPMLAGLLVFTYRLPTDPGILVAFAFSLLLAVVVAFAINFMISLSAFWLLDDRGVAQIAMVIEMFFSGFIVPLVFFPHWLEPIARALPYAAIVQLPIEVLLGKHHGLDLAGVLAVELGWAIVLLIAGRGVLALATRRVVVQGG
jgi:ABC-2 type transport system permease protein